MDKVLMTQADREAAWLLRPSCYFDHDKEAWMNGRYDIHYTIQALARHRIAALESAAVCMNSIAEDARAETRSTHKLVAETLSEVLDLCATFIRAFKEPTNEAE
jgi:hypothetical protein